MATKRKAFALLLSTLLLGATSMVRAAAADLAATIAATPELSTFHKAVTEAGLVDLLKSIGPHTVFVPTDDAFKRLPAGTMAALMKPESRASLVKLVRHHIIASRIATQDIVNKEFNVKTLADQDLLLDGDEPADGIKIGKGKVIKPDIAADNGIVHHVNHVMLP